MKTIGLLVAGGAVVLGQTGTAGLGPMAPYVQVGSTATIVAILFWIIVVDKPKERKEAQRQIQASQAHTETVVGKVCEQFAATQEQQHADNTEINRSIQALASNCATHLHARTDKD